MIALSRPDIVFISKQRLVGATNGSSAYLIDLARAVRAAGMVPHLVQPSPDVAGRMPILTLRPEMAVFETHVIRGMIRMGNRFVTPAPRVYAAVARAAVSRIARALGSRARWTQDKPLPYAIAIPWSDADRRFVNRAARGKAAAAVADYMFCAEGLRSLPDPSVPSAIVMHDLFHAREGGASDSVALVDRDREIALLGQADAVIAIQAAEAAFVDANVPGTRAILASMAAEPVSAPQPGIGTKLLFVGSNTAPNIVGLKWLFDEVWPIVRSSWPEAILQIAGTAARAFPEGGPDGVTFLGLVGDLKPLYAEAGLVLSPLTFGSGLKIKLIEALAMGKATVATSVTLQGVEAQCTGAVAHVDDPGPFAAAILQYGRDDAARAGLASAALEAARRHFSADACYGEFTRWLRAAADRSA